MKHWDPVALDGTTHLFPKTEEAKRYIAEVRKTRIDNTVKARCVVGLWVIQLWYHDSTPDRWDGIMEDDLRELDNRLMKIAKFKLQIK